MEYKAYFESEKEIPKLVLDNLDENLLLDVYLSFLEGQRVSVYYKLLSSFIEKQNEGSGDEVSDIAYLLAYLIYIIETPLNFNIIASYYLSFVTSGKSKSKAIWLKELI